MREIAEVYQLWSKISFEEHAQEHVDVVERILVVFAITDRYLTMQLCHCVSLLPEPNVGVGGGPLFSISLEAKQTCAAIKPSHGQSDEDKMKYSLEVFMQLATAMCAET